MLPNYAAASSTMFVFEDLIFLKVLIMFINHLSAGKPSLPQIAGILDSSLNFFKGIETMTQ